LARLSNELSNYREKLVSERESILSAKTLTTAQAEETSDLQKLDFFVHPAAVFGSTRARGLPKGRCQ
jgi:hypothetical protein